MAKLKEPKTRDDRAKAYFRMYSNMVQNKTKLASGEISEEDLWIRAYDKADQKIKEELDQGYDAVEKVRDAHQELVKFRNERENQYRTAYDWNTSSDERTLNNILDNEVYTREITQELERPALTQLEREKLLDRHSKLIKDHRDLLSSAGVDRLSREKKAQTFEPMEDWDRVKRQAFEKMEELRREFGLAADRCEDEFELMNIMKYHLGFEFDGIIGKILSTHRRTLGLPEELQSEQE